MCSKSVQITTGIITLPMSIEVFGRKVGMSARQIARYEKEEYQNITTSTLQKILGNLDIHIDGKIAMAA